MAVSKECEVLGSKAAAETLQTESLELSSIGTHCL